MTRQGQLRQKVFYMLFRGTMRPKNLKKIVLLSNCIVTVDPQGSEKHLEILASKCQTCVFRTASLAIKFKRNFQLNYLRGDSFSLYILGRISIPNETLLLLRSYLFTLQERYRHWSESYTKRKNPY